MNMRKLALATLLAITSSAAEAATVCVSGEVEKPIEDVWRAIRDFGSHAFWIEGKPQITLEGGSGATVGVLRHTVFPNGVRFDEVLTALDDETYMIKYDVVGDIPLPIYDVRGVIQLYPVSASEATLAERCLYYDTPLPQAEAEAFRLTRVESLAGSLKLLAAALKR